VARSNLKSDATSNDKLQRFTKTLGHDFRDPAWLVLALTHRSVSGSRNNERLEFLGDSILNFVIADFLYQQFPAEKEGNLSRLRASLVKQETLASVARDLPIGDFLKLGPGELKSGCFRRESILADALEALLGAIYRDTGDMAYCAERVYGWFGDRLNMVGQAVEQGGVLKDSKSRLQEFLQGRRLSLPVYTVLETSGDAHNQMFKVSVSVPGVSTDAEGQGPSRRIAEQEAAAAALRQLGIEPVLQDSDE
jgi:ribonuclease-3